MTNLTDIVTEDPRWQDLGLDSLAETAARSVLSHLGVAAEGYEIAILACDDTRIATLNAEFRGKETPTNVLSWPAWDLAAETPGGPPAPPPAPEPGPGETLGDLAISWDTCAREAHAAAKPLDQHVTHLVVHGVLHLLGYDHVRDPDATLMEGLETEILGKLGIPDPYREHEGS